MDIGKVICALRLSQGLTQLALAQKCGIAAPTLCRLESGQRSPNIKTLHRVAKGLGTHASHLSLLEGDGKGLPVVLSESRKILMRSLKKALSRNLEDKDIQALLDMVGE